MKLTQYHQKRKFSKTPEPKGKIKESKSANPIFVVQKHAASHLHYDFRLEIDGVLKSWAVPKGPSLDPSIKRLAVQVEDHPLEYATFEGIIPKGHYGGGTVMLWDKGTWQPLSDEKDPKKHSSFHFELKGKKLKGIWKLVQIKKDPKNWLLIKSQDKEAVSQDEYDILDTKPLSVVSKKSMNEIAVPEFNFRLTHPDRIIYPKIKITKLDVAQYYEAVQDWILPFIINRPFSILHCTDTITDGCFFQKHIVKNKQTQHIFSGDKYLYIKNIEGLMELIQMGAIEIHAYGNRIDKPDRPDSITFDLDPGEGVSWKKVRETAFLIKDELENLGLVSFLKTTGGKGLHVVIPIIRRYDWEYVSLFAKTFSEYIASKYPDDYASNMLKSNRKNKIYIDYLRNKPGASSIAPYALRAREGATVATPLAWDELTTKLKPTDFNIKTIIDKLNHLSVDPWEDFFELKQKLPK